MPTTTVPFSQQVIESGTASADSIGFDERRCHMRGGLALGVKMVGSGCNDVGGCTVRNISEGGLFLHAPIDSGLTVGQRFELVSSQEEASQDSSIPEVDGWFATVVRTGPIVEADSTSLGVGVRFDQPVFL